MFVKPPAPGSMTLATAAVSARPPHRNKRESPAVTSARCPGAPDRGQEARESYPFAVQQDAATAAAAAATTGSKEVALPVGQDEPVTEILPTAPISIAPPPPPPGTLIPTPPPLPPWSWPGGPHRHARRIRPPTRPARYRNRDASATRAAEATTTASTIEAEMNRWAEGGLRDADAGGRRRRHHRGRNRQSRGPKPPPKPPGPPLGLKPPGALTSIVPPTVMSPRDSRARAGATG